MTKKGAKLCRGMSICSAAGMTACTTDVQRRFQEHRSGTGARYTRSRPPVTLVYTEAAADRSAAQRREAAIKKLPRAQKLKLIEKGEGV